MSVLFSALKNQSFQKFLAILRAKGVTVGKTDIPHWYKNFQNNFGYSRYITPEHHALKKSQNWHLSKNMDNYLRELAKNKGKSYTSKKYYG